MTVRRVLQVHTWYRQAGGEDQVVEAERRLLDEVQHQLRVLVLEETGRDPGRGGKP